MTVGECKAGDRVHLQRRGKPPLYEVQETEPITKRMGYASLVQVGDSPHALQWDGQRVDVDRLTICHKEAFSLSRREAFPIRKRKDVIP